MPHRKEQKPIAEKFLESLIGKNKEFLHLPPDTSAEITATSSEEFASWAWSDRDD
jgi:hypothetical protein